MAAPTTSNVPVQTDASADVSPYTEGLVAGVVGAATIAAWFLVLDTLSGRPFYTPTVLGTALFRRGALPDLTTLAPSIEMVAMFTWVHVLVFAALGVVAARLIRVSERNPSYGFGLVLMFVVSSAVFFVAALIFSAPVLRVVTWPAVLAGNLLAAAAMAAYFWRRHLRLAVLP